MSKRKMIVNLELMKALHMPEEGDMDAYAQRVRQMGHHVGYIDIGAVSAEKKEKLREYMRKRAVRRDAERSNNGLIRMKGGVSVQVKPRGRGAENQGGVMRRRSGEEMVFDFRDGDERVKKRVMDAVVKGDEKMSAKEVLSFIEDVQQLVGVKFCCFDKAAAQVLISERKGMFWSEEEE